MDDHDVEEIKGSSIFDLSSKNTNHIKAIKKEKKRKAKLPPRNITRKKKQHTFSEDASLNNLGSQSKSHQSLIQSPKESTSKMK